ncbi:hypothetical protein, partial [Flavobacterium sp.]|uniref:hypothetical protein n=1 Tax=Flavobacterium sp. TaxID=239 RepID=UPI0037BE705A
PSHFNNSVAAGNGRNLSLRYGFADPNAAEGVQRGIFSGTVFNVPALYNTVSGPGGSRGALESELIDLRNYSADDQPHLYFNYRLSTEDANSWAGTNTNAFDSFRVYGTSEDGNWVLLSTNNAPEVNSSDTVNNRLINAPFNQAGATEFDLSYSKNFDVYGRPGITTELFDNAGWRQARVNLGSLAGKQDVRLRFEFATGGSFRSVKTFDVNGNAVVDSERNGIEINAVPGQRIVNSPATPDVEAVHTFSLSQVDAIGAAVPNSTTTFQFDLGLVLNVPSGLSVKTGDRIKIGANFFTFDNAIGPRNIPFLATDTPAELAVKVRTALEGITAPYTDPVRLDRYTVATSTNAPSLLNVTHIQTTPASNFVRLPDSVAAGDYDILGGADKAIIVGRPGVQAGNVPVFVTNAMTAIQVRDAIRLALAGRFNIPSQSTNINTYRINNNTIFFHSPFNNAFTSFTGSFSGPVSVSSGRTGDAFGALNTAGTTANTSYALRSAFATRNNTGAVQGVQIDDIIIGFAERGEVVYNAPANNQTFRETPFYEPFVVIGQPAVEEPELGTYQLEIRTAADYGITDRNGRLDLVDPSIANVNDPQALYYGNNQWGRTFDTNDRLTKSIALQVTAPASQIVDGSFFTLSDGYNTATFEFDVRTSVSDPQSGVVSGRIAVPLSPAFTAVQVARAIRGAINGPTSLSLLKLSASTTGDMDNANASVTGARSDVIFLNGTAAADALGGMNFTTGGAPIRTIEYGNDTTEYIPRSNPPNLPVRPSAFFDYGQDLGDGNILREQGQFIVSSSIIRDSAGFGVNVDAASQQQSGASALTGARPYPGSVRNLITLNSGNVAPGAVVINNVIFNNAAGGISISRDSNNANGAPPSTVSRIINNTIHGGGTGDGIRINNGAAPTIINNIVSNFATGIQIAAASIGRTELGYNIYKQNGTNVTAGQAETGAISLVATDPLFVDPSRGLFYPAPLSRTIDSSISSIGNRAAIEQVRSAVGLGSSTIFAPFLDLYGLVRSDDPAVSAPDGFGQNVFIDRGAIDRVDFSGPIATLTRPIDNDSLGDDRDQGITVVRLTSGNLDFFEILLDEFSGTGTDASTVNGNTVILTENGRPLVEGSDYFFGFSANSRTIRLTPTAGFWRNDSIYEITLINKPTVRYNAPAGAAALDGSTLVVTFPDANGQPVSPITFEFDNNNSVTGSNTRIPFTVGWSSEQVAQQLAIAIANARVTGFRAIPVGSGTLAIEGFATFTGTGSIRIPPITDLAANRLQPNRGNGLTQFTILMPEVALDYGDAMQIANTGFVTPTPQASDGARAAIYPIDFPV